MRSLVTYVNEDANQFGPGTDLVVSLLAVLMVMTFITTYLHSQSQKEGDDDFRLASAWIPAADFKVYPVTELKDRTATVKTVKQIADDYRQSQQEFGYIFVIGHTNEIDDPTASDRSDEARWQRNWQFGIRRAAVIAALLQQHLSREERDRVVVMTTGEFDKREPAKPYGQENAWVEVVFGRKWKPPSTMRR